MTTSTSTPVNIDWNKLPCVIVTGSDTDTLREAALKLGNEVDLKHWIVSDCHEEQHIEQISAEIRKSSCIHKVLIFEGDTRRFARTYSNRSVSLMEFLTPRTSRLNCALVVLAPDIRPSKLYIELRVSADYIVHISAKDQPLTVKTMDMWYAEVTDTCQ